MSETPPPLRVGLVGTGAISQIVHVPIFSERIDVTLSALADVDPHKAETLSRRHDVPLVMDVDDLIDYDELDAVVLCSPNVYHEDQAIAALEAGKHVLVERPISLTPAGATRVVEVAREKGLVLSVGMPHRFRPEALALRDAVASGDLGRVTAARVSWMTRPTPAMRSQWRENREIAGGGALMDLGIAAVDLCMWMVGYPAIRRVSCVLDRSTGELENAATLMAETTDGAVISVEVTNRLYAGEDRYRARVMGTEGSGSIPPLKVFKLLGGRPQDITPRQPTPRGGENPYTNAYRRLLDDFVRRVKGTVEAPLPDEQAELMTLIRAAYEAADSGREVLL